MADAAIAPAALTADDVRKIFTESIGEALKGGIGDLLKPVNDKLTAVEARLNEERPAALADAEKLKADLGKPMTPDAIANLVNKTLSDGLKSFSQQQQTSADRDRFVGSHLGKLPDAYKRLLGNDPSKWADEAKKIQSSFETDFKGSGGKPENLGGASRDGGTTAAHQTVDKSKMSPIDRIAQGLTASKPNPAAVPPSAVAPAN